MQYLVRPAGKWHIVYASPHGCTVREELSFEQALREAALLNEMLGVEFSPQRERDRVERQYGRDAHGIDHWPTAIPENGD